MSPLAAILLKALRDNAEGCQVIQNNGEIWQTVYLENAYASVRQRCNYEVVGLTFSGLLSYLHREKLYRPLNGHFGEVKLESPATD